MSTDRPACTRRAALARRLAPWLVCAWAAAAGAAPPFELREFPGPGRTAAADLADFDGDGRADLLAFTFLGMPPRENRRITLRFQREDGSFPESPDWKGPLPEGSGPYDIARLGEGPASELLLLLRDRILLLSFPGRRLQQRELALPGLSVAVAPDERGIERLPLLRRDLAPEPRLLVPGLGECFVLTPSGETLARLDVGARANYLVPPRPGPVYAESEIELYFDVPRLLVGDVNGDTRADVISSSRHEVRVFLQRQDGSFPRRPDREQAPKRLSEADHIRNSGSVRVDGADFGGDGLIDLLVAQTGGGFLDANSEIALYVNRGDGWNLEDPDQVFQLQGGAMTHQLVDLDGDGRPELLEGSINLGVFNVIEVLVTRGLDAQLAIRRPRDGAGGEPYVRKPWYRRELGIGFSFERFRPKGFVPTLDVDLNNDGHRDLLTSGDGDALQIYLGNPRDGFRRRTAEQKLDTSGLIRFGHLDGDGLPDFILYDPRDPDSPIRMGVNLGTLPGSRAQPTVRARP